MANDYLKRPIVIDTAGGGAEQADSVFWITSIEWVQPTAGDHVATLLDGSGNTLAKFRCVTAYLNMIKYFSPPVRVIDGLNCTQLTSGTLFVTTVPGR